VAFTAEYFQAKAVRLTNYFKLQNRSAFNLALQRERMQEIFLSLLRLSKVLM
jgi:hypothetical protein